jgi:hypothetical protein
MFRRTLPVLARALTGAGAGPASTSRAAGAATAVRLPFFSTDAAAGDGKARANGWGQTRVHELLDAKVRVLEEAGRPWRNFRAAEIRDLAMGSDAPRKLSPRRPSRAAACRLSRAAVSEDLDLRAERWRCGVGRA